MIVSYKPGPPGRLYRMKVSFANAESGRGGALFAPFPSGCPLGIATTIRSSSSGRTVNPMTSATGERTDNGVDLLIVQRLHQFAAAVLEHERHEGRHLAVRADDARHKRMKGGELGSRRRRPRSPRAVRRVVAARSTWSRIARADPEKRPASVSSTPRGLRRNSCLHRVPVRARGSGGSTAAAECQAGGRRG